MLQQVITFALIPALAIFLGGLFASFYPPSHATKTFVQHLAAGVVFAALVGEVLPDLTAHHPSPVSFVISFALGVALMLSIRRVVETKLQKPGAADNPTTLILVVGLDILIDGILIGFGVSLGEINGVLLTAALGLEILFLGLSTGGEMVAARFTRKQIVTTLGILMIPPIVGVFAGGYLLAGMSEGAMVVLLSFAAAALLYLVTEELLVEAHEVPETPFSTAMFFVGFVVFYVLEMML